MGQLKNEIRLHMVVHNLAVAERKVCDGCHRWYSRSGGFAQFDDVHRHFLRLNLDRFALEICTIM
jgi:hypothetical protein